MATATPNSAKALYAEPKQKLCEKVNANIQSFAILSSSISQKSTENLNQTIQNYLTLESSILQSEKNLSKLDNLTIHLNYQYESIEKLARNLDDLREQSQSMRR